MSASSRSHAKAAARPTSDLAEQARRAFARGDFASTRLLDAQLLSAAVPGDERRRTEALQRRASLRWGGLFYGQVAVAAALIAAAWAYALLQR